MDDDFEFVEVFGTPLIVLAGHPYFDHAGPSVFPSWNNTWVVKWRDFYSMKQDADFETEQEARAFAELVCKPPLTVENYCDEDLAASDAFWRSLDR